MENTKVKKITVSSIEWDATESETAALPQEVVVVIDEDNADLLEDINGYADNLCEYLSDEYGYCIKGCCVDVE